MKQWQWAFAQAFLTIIVSAVIGGIFWVSYTESNKPLSIFGPEIKPTKIPEDRLARQVYWLYLWSEYRERLVTLCITDPEYSPNYSTYYYSQECLRKCPLPLFHLTLFSLFT